jgi:hypothetical protein
MVTVYTLHPSRPGLPLLLPGAASDSFCEDHRYRFGSRVGGRRASASRPHSHRPARMGRAGLLGSSWCNQRWGHSSGFAITRPMCRAETAELRCCPTCRPQVSALASTGIPPKTRDRFVDHSGSCQSQTHVTQRSNSTLCSTSYHWNQPSKRRLIHFVRQRKSRSRKNYHRPGPRRKLKPVH